MKKENSMLEELLDHLPEYWILEKSPWGYECYDGYVKSKVTAFTFTGSTAEEAVQKAVNYLYKQIVKV